MSEFGSLSSLIERARQGNGAARNMLCERIRPQIEVLANRQFPGALGAKIGESDLVQEALLGVAQSISTFTGRTEQELLAWVRGILENKALELQRRFLGISKRDLTREQPIAGLNSSQPGAVLADRSKLPLDKMVLAEDRARIKLLILELPAHYQKVLELKYHQRLSFPEIASQMQRTEPSVKNILVRAMEMLEKKLAANGNDIQ